MCLVVQTIQHFNHHFFLCKTKPKPDKCVEILQKYYDIIETFQTHFYTMAKYISDGVLVSMTDFFFAREQHVCQQTDEKKTQQKKIKNLQFKSKSIFTENNANRQSWCHEGFTDVNTTWLTYLPRNLHER